MATERLSRVVAAVNRDWDRAITAVAPALPLRHVAAGGSEWRGGLLALVTPRDIVALALPQLMSGTVAARRTALSRLATVAPHLGRSALPLPMPQAADGIYARLADLLRPVVEPEVESVTRNRPVTPRGSGSGSPSAPPRGPGLPPTATDGLAPEESEGSAQTGGDGPASADDEVRSAYALLDAPDYVPPGRPFELRGGGTHRGRASARAEVLS